MSYAPKQRAAAQTPSPVPPPPPVRSRRVEVDSERAEKSFRLLTNGTAVETVTQAHVARWFEREFGTVTRLTSLEARAAKSILQRHVPALALSVRAFVFQLLDQLEAQARQQESILRPLATQVGITRLRSRDPVGVVWALIQGKQVTLGEDAVNVWLLGGGRFIAWSGLDGTGGFENEGQSLRVYDTHSGRGRKMLSEDFEITLVTSQLLSNGRWALLVEMRDGQMDGEHFAVVNPERGETFRAKLSRRVALKEDSLTLGFFRTAELSRPVSARVCFRSEAFDMKRLIEAPLVTRPGV